VAYRIYGPEPARKPLLKLVKLSFQEHVFITVNTEHERDFGSIFRVAKNALD
jgi:hypothetical protein